MHGCRRMVKCMDRETSAKYPYQYYTRILQVPCAILSRSIPRMQQVDQSQLNSSLHVHTTLLVPHKLSPEKYADTKTTCYQLVVGNAS